MHFDDGREPAVFEQKSYAKSKGKPGADTDQMISNATAAALESGMVREGDRVVVVAGVPVGRPGQTNLLKVETI